MRNRFLGSFVALAALAATLVFSTTLFAQGGAKAGGAQAGAAAHDIFGVWNFDENGGPGIAANLVPKDVTMTAWGQEKFKENGTTLSGTTYNNCEPLGFTSYPAYPHPIEIQQIPGRIIIFHEVDHVWRTIWMDGRPLPKLEDMPYGPSILGTSIGHWDGNDLVIETIGLNEKTWLDTAHHPHSDQMKVTERFHRVDHDNMAVTMTFDDPKAYTKTFSWGPKNLHFKSGPDWELGEDMCSPAEQRAFQKNVETQLNEEKK